MPTTHILRTHYPQQSYVRVRVRVTMNNAGRTAAGLVAGLWTGLLGLRCVARIRMAGRVAAAGTRRRRRSGPGMGEWEYARIMRAVWVAGHSSGGSPLEEGI